MYQQITKKKKVGSETKSTAPHHKHDSNIHRMTADDNTEMTITEISFGKFGITAPVNLDISLKHG
jgi:hypothetical protein